VDIISSNRDNTDNETLKILSDMDNLEKSILQIQSMLERVSHYVKQVVVSIILIIIYNIIVYESLSENTYILNII